MKAHDFSRVEFQSHHEFLTKFHNISTRPSHNALLHISIRAEIAYSSTLMAAIAKSIKK